MAKNLKLTLIILLTTLVFLPSFNNFFTHDDFFHFKISQPVNISQFVAYFNPLNTSENWNYYRPIPTQVFYFIGARVFNYNHILMHILNFVFFVLTIYLVYRFFKLITKSPDQSFIGTFIYSLSATHFSKLYFLGAHQEVSLAFFFMAGVLFFTKFIINGKNKFYFYSLGAFILSLMSKETAVILPLILGLIFMFLKFSNRINLKWQKIITLLVPFALLDLIYIFFKLQAGLPQGDSYIWDISLRVFNTLIWYGMWALNLPEMFVDFIGPGLNINNRLFLWKPWVQIIIGLFILEIILIVYLFIKKINKLNLLPILFSLSWFVVTLLPVLFLPWHKFTIYLTLPMIGAAFFLSYLIKGTKFKIPFLTVFVLCSIFSLVLSYKTHWIVQGAKTAREVNQYVNSNLSKLKKSKLIFYNTPEQENSPWVPTKNLKNALSDQNFFKVFYDEVEVIYVSNYFELNQYQGVKVKASKFLNH